MSMSPEAVDGVPAGLGRAGVTAACYLPNSPMKELYAALIAALDIRTIPSRTRARALPPRALI